MIFGRIFYGAKIFKKSAPDAIREYEESQKKNEKKYLLRSRAVTEVTFVLCAIYFIYFSSLSSFFANYESSGKCFK